MSDTGGRSFADRVEHAGWCTQETHHYEVGQCVSPAIEIGDRACWVWLEQDDDGHGAPRLVVDTPRDGANLTCQEATQLCAALEWLCRAVREDDCA